jgi:phosphoenolpyruvate carboxylase
MSSLISRLEKLESMVPDADSIINSIIRFIVDKADIKKEVNYIKPRGSDHAYIRQQSEDEDSFIDRACKDYRKEINASEKQVLLFLAYSK